MAEVTSTSEAKKLLKKKGSKVALQCVFDGPFIYAEKRDFINSIKLDKFADYDGDMNPVLWKNNVLHIYAGTLF